MWGKTVWSMHSTTSVGFEVGKGPTSLSIIVMPNVDTLRRFIVTYAQKTTLNRAWEIYQEEGSKIQNKPFNSRYSLQKATNFLWPDHANIQRDCPTVRSRQHPIPLALVRSRDSCFRVDEEYSPSS